MDTIHIRKILRQKVTEIYEKLWPRNRVRTKNKSRTKFIKIVCRLNLFLYKMKTSAICFFFKNTKCEERIFFFIRIPRGDNELAGAFVVFSSF